MIFIINSSIKPAPQPKLASLCGQRNSRIFFVFKADDRVSLILICKRSSLHILLQPSENLDSTCMFAVIYINRCQWWCLWRQVQLWTKVMFHLKWPNWLLQTKMYTGNVVHHFNSGPFWCYCQNHVDYICAYLQDSLRRLKFVNFVLSSWSLQMWTFHCLGVTPSCKYRLYMNGEHVLRIFTYFL